MSPMAKSSYLLYASVSYAYVDVYSYPQAKQVGQLGGFAQAQGLCGNDNGDVWVTDPGTGDITGYTHGGSKPIRVLDYGTKFTFQECAIDSTTGNLAVPIYAQSNGNNSKIAIYRRAKGKPILLPYPVFEPLYCTYDDKGNLFLNGFDTASEVVFDELEKGAHTVRQIALPREINADGPLGWDGEYLAVFNSTSEEKFGIYRMTIVGNKAKEAGYTPLDGGNVSALAIKTPIIVGSDPNSTSIDFWRYPKGGEPFKSLTNLFYSEGVAISPP